MKDSEIISAVSNINYYYRQTIESEGIKKLITSTSGIAFYTLQSIQWTAMLILLASLVPPSCTLDLTNYLQNNYLEKWKERISNQAPSHSLQKIIHRIEFIAFSAFTKSFTYSKYGLLILTAIPLLVSSAAFYGIYIASNYIEYVSTKISQKALDIIGIPVQLSISEIQLKSILKNWRTRSLPGEQRKLAYEEILKFYDESRDLLGNIISNKELSLENYQLRDLPDIFHYKPFCNITKLCLSSNQLTTFPESINALQRLNKLSLANNFLTRLPNILYSLPPFCEVTVSSNRFSQREVESISAITNESTYNGPQFIGIAPYNEARGIDFIRDSEGFTIYTQSIDEFYSVLYRSIDREQPDLSNIEKSYALQSWLYRLTSLPSYNQIINRNIINFLEEANQNKEFYPIFTKIIEEASNTCGDRVSLSILHLDIFYQLEKIELTDMKKLSTFLFRGCWAIELLEQCAREKVEQCAREKVGSNTDIDVIAVFLGYPISLKEKLHLPISQNSMLYFSSSNLTPQDLDNAEEFVTSHLNNKDGALNFLIQHDKWREALRHNKASAIAAIERQREQALDASSPDYEAIQNSYDQALKDLSRKILDW